MNIQTPSDGQLPFSIFAGLTLEQALQKEPAPWPTERVLALLQSIASVISGLHAQGGVHGSLNPRNVRFEANGRVVLDNFGQYRAADKPPIDRVIARYYTPEQALGGEPNAQSDIYSLGALTFELLTGAPLFDDEEPENILYQHRTAALRFAGALRPELRPEVDKVLVRALARDPRQRFHLVKHLVEGLSRALQPSEAQVRSLTPEATSIIPPKAESLPIAKPPVSDSKTAKQFEIPQQLQPPSTAPPINASQNALKSSAPELELPQAIAQSPLLQTPVAQSPAPTPLVQAPLAQAPLAQAQQSEAASPLQSLQGTPLIPAARNDENRPGTEIWTPPAPPPPQTPPKRRSLLSAFIAIGVVVLMIAGIRMQPPPPVQKSDPQELARLRAKYLDAKPPKLLPFPDEAKQTGILKKVLMTDYMSLLVEQYKGMYLGLFSELESAKKKAEGAEREAKRLQNEVKTAKKSMDARADVLQGQLTQAQAEAARAQSAVNSAKRSVDAANQKMSYFQGEYNRLKSNVPAVAQ